MLDAGVSKNHTLKFKVIFYFCIADVLHSIEKVYASNVHEQ